VTFSWAQTIQRIFDCSRDEFAPEEGQEKSPCFASKGFRRFIKSCCLKLFMFRADQAKFLATKSQFTTFQNASTNFGRALR
jgi:hypothetical protein